MKKMIFSAIMFFLLLQFETAWSMGLKLPEFEKEEKITFTNKSILAIPDFSAPKSFPNLTENKLHSGYQFNGYQAAAATSETWEKIKGTWDGPVTNVILKVTGKSNNNVFIWAGVHSFFDAWTDATAHSRGETHFFHGDNNWHIVKNCRDFSAIMTTLNFSRRIFIEKIPVKEATQDLICVGLIRIVIFNTSMKIIKGGPEVYNDPYYNQRAITYWWFGDGGLTDKYIATGRITTPLLDGLAIGGFIFKKTWKF
ncbi:MAG: hypothetical protein WC582_00165 [Patescibacteria group bacterium]|jgi:hypothetical protein